MFSLLRKIFGKKGSTDPGIPKEENLSGASFNDGNMRKLRSDLPQTVSGESIYSYLQKLDKEDRDRLLDEVSNRGLSFGDLRVEQSFGCKIAFRTSRKKIKDSLPEDVSKLLSDILLEKGFNGISILKEDNIVLTLSDSSTKRLEGIWEAGWKGGKTYQRNVFLQVGNFNGLYAEAYSAEAVDVVLSLAKKLGLETEPANYSYESEVPLSDVVEHALSWKDSLTGKYYAEMKYDPALEKSLVYIGGSSHEEFAEDSKKVVVLASGYGTNKFRINNRIVPTTTVYTPTKFMLKTREKIRERNKKRFTCKVGDCGREASFEVHVVRHEIKDGFGSCSMGGVIAVCDDPEHLGKIKSSAGGVRQTVRAVVNDVW